MKKVRSMALFCGVLISASSIGSTPAVSQEKAKPETIQATAQGSEVQLGKQFNVTLNIERYSTMEDRQNLTTAFQADKSQGLYKALSKTKSVGHIAIGNGIGYDVSYIRSIPTSTGRTIQFITTRPISMREEENASLSSDYNLTAGQLELNDMDKSKSTGVLYPRAMLTMDQNNEITFELATDPYKLTDVIDSGNTLSSKAR